SLCEKRPGGRSVPIPVLVATIGDSVQGNVDARARPGHGAVVAKLGLRIDSTVEFSSWRPAIHNRTPPRGSRRACARGGRATAPGAGTILRRASPAPFIDSPQAAPG